MESTITNNYTGVSPTKREAMKLNNNAARKQSHQGSNQERRSEIKRRACSESS